MGILANKHRVDNESFNRGKWITLSLKYQRVSSYRYQSGWERKVFIYEHLLTHGSL